MLLVSDQGQHCIGCYHEMSKGSPTSAHYTATLIKTTSQTTTTLKENVTDRAPPERLLDAIEISDGTPALGDETLLRDVQVEHVERVVDGLDLAHLDEPHLDVLGRRHQHAMTVVLGLG